MSTRAIYTFDDGTDRYHVYKHHDGYPSGAAKAIQSALDYAWPLPRFEADEFGASFCAGTKQHEKGTSRRGGGTRLLPCGEWEKVAPGDVQFRYEIRPNGKELRITAFTVRCSIKNETWTEKQIFDGPLSKLAEIES